MSDQDFNFTPPPPRRERKEFEPPPWEQHLFERLAKQQESESPRQESTEAAEQDVALNVPKVLTVAAASEELGVSEALPPDGDKDTVDGKRPPLDEVRVAAMMFELKAEEAPATQMYERVALATGVTLLFIGLVILIWAFVMIAVALRRPEQGRSGVYVGMTVLVFGVGLVGTGAWFVFKTLRQQGVL